MIGLIFRNPDYVFSVFYKSVLGGSLEIR